jgi:hypothetical protein
MKKIATILVVLLALMMVISCGGGGGDSVDKPLEFTAATVEGSGDWTAANTGLSVAGAKEGENGALKVTWKGAMAEVFNTVKTPLESIDLADFDGYTFKMAYANDQGLEAWVTSRYTDGDPLNKGSVYGLNGNGALQTEGDMLWKTMKFPFDGDTAAFKPWGGATVDGTFAAWIEAEEVTRLYVVLKDGNATDEWVTYIDDVGFYKDGEDSEILWSFDVIPE